MKVYIKDLAVSMEIGNKGVEIDVSDTQSSHLGDFYVTKSSLIWCKGRTSKENGSKISWELFMKIMDNLPVIRRALNNL